MMLNNIEAERVRKRYSQENIAKELGVSLKTYQNYIKEETNIPSSILIKMARIFETDIDYLLEGAKGFVDGK